MSLPSIVIASLLRSSVIAFVALSLCPQLRDIEEMLAMRGVALTYETVRDWCLKFDQNYANNLREKLRGVAISGI